MYDSQYTMILTAHPLSFLQCNHEPPLCLLCPLNSIWTASFMHSLQTGAQIRTLKAVHWWREGNGRGAYLKGCLQSVKVLKPFKVVTVVNHKALK
jgi:hypothetical protein